MPKNKLEPTEAQIQSAIIGYLGTRRDLIFWRQNSGSFTAAAIRAVMGVLSSVNIGPVKHRIIAAVKKSLGHYKCTSISGLPDITVVYKGQYIGLEVKTKTGRLTKDQKVLHPKMAKVGAKVFIVRSLDEVIEILR